MSGTRGPRAGDGGGSDTGCPIPIVGSDIRCRGGYLVALFTLEVAHSKAVAVAVHWQTGRLATAGAWGMAPQTSAKAPSRGF